MSRKKVAEMILSQPTYDSTKTIVDMVEDAYKSEETDWIPVKNDKTNLGDVEITDSVIQAITELISNSIDGYIEPYVEQFESREKILDQAYDNPSVLLSFDGMGNTEFSFMVADEACGIGENEFEDALLRNPSEGGINKKNYDLLNGKFAQGSLASIGISKDGCKFVASASEENPSEFTFTVTRYNKEEMRYEYFVVNGDPPTFSGSLRVDDLGTISSGTVTKVFNADKDQTPRNFSESPFIRNLGHKIPQLPVSLKIVDNRIGISYSSIDWDGVRPELDLENNVNRVSKTDSTPYGSIEIHAYYAEEGVNLSNDYLVSNSNRIFYEINGITHHEDSKRKVEKKCELNGISDNILIFVDCSELDELNDIFVHTRDSMKQDSKKSKDLRESVYESIREWEKLQQFSKDRLTVEDVVDGNSPLNDLKLLSQDEPIETNEGRFDEEIQVDSDYPSYSEHDNLTYNFFNASNCQVNPDGDKVSISGIAEEESLILCVKDTQYNESQTVEFKVSEPSSDKKIQSLTRRGPRSIEVDGKASASFDVEHTDKEYWMSDMVNVDVTPITEGDFDSTNIKKKQNSLEVEFDPCFADGESLVTEVCVKSESEKRRDTVVLVESKNSRVPESIEKLDEKYGESGSININSVLNKMSEKERELISGTTFEKINNLFDIDYSVNPVVRTDDGDNKTSWNPDIDEDILQDDLGEICSKIGIKPEKEIEFMDGDPAVHEVVNKILEPYGFENRSKGQFRRIGGGSAESADKVPNYGENVDSYTYMKDIVRYCKGALKNSIWIERDIVAEEISTAESWVRSNSLHTGSRTNIGTIQRTATGFVAERAVKKHADQYGLNLELNRDKYDSRQNTDGGIDIESVNGQDPPKDVQIKSIKWYLLVDVTEFFQKEADTYVGYKTHIPDEKKFIAGETGCRVVPHGWARQEEFELQAKEIRGKKYGLKFDRDHNMSLPRCELNPMKTLFNDISEELKTNQSNHIVSD